MSRKPKALRAARQALQVLYDSLPKLECKGLCQESCGRIDECVPMVEREMIARSPAIVHGDDKGSSCPLLTPSGRCSAHPVRPLICRLWGLVDDPLMICPHGCRPEPRYLSNVEARRLWNRLSEIERRHKSQNEIYEP